MAERVDFYVLSSQSPEGRRHLACRLSAKAYMQALSVVVWCASGEEAGRCDELLWTFDDRAFVPHRLVRAAEPIDAETPVHLTAELDAVERADLLVNLANRLPAGLDRFARIAEIVDADAEVRRLGRERFKAYREHKLALETHQLADTSDV